MLHGSNAATGRLHDAEMINGGWSTIPMTTHLPEVEECDPFGDYPAVSAALVTIIGMDVLSPEDLSASNIKSGTGVSSKDVR
ncbi:hypothetical protein VTN00DRAFT_8223 [Thermoascus crustaceus]|uniref:uncharacterized protein n=1 Tax=Thermoascus crustaceus TaxID=5088 RepID=UPI003744400F